MKSTNKKHYTIKFSIPLWVIEPFEKLAYQYRKWKYWLHPDHCACCGKRMYVSSFEIEHVFSNGRRLAVHNHAYIQERNKSLVVCRDCLVNHLETGEWEPRFTHSSLERGYPLDVDYRFWTADKCAVTGHDVKSYKCVEIYPYVDMTFCTNAWNHDYISKEAVIECVKHGIIRTSHWGVYKKKRMAPMNNKGLFIDEEGKLL